MNRFGRETLHGSSAKAVSEAQPKNQSCRQIFQKPFREDCRLQSGAH